VELQGFPEKNSQFRERPGNQCTGGQVKRGVKVGLAKIR
jgi:hypothetical protein